MHHFRQGIRGAVRLTVLWLLFFATCPAFAQQDLDEEFPPGLLARYAAAGKSIERVDTDISFDWGSLPPDARLPGGEFTAEWKGQILIREAVEFRFHAFIAGEVSIEVDGKTVLAGRADQPAWISGDATSLGFGEREFRVRYRKTSGDSRLSLFWSSNTFPVEPIPYYLFFHGARTEALSVIERGRQAFEVHRCNRCHQRENDLPSRPAPSLDHLAGSASLDFIASQIVEPSKSTTHSRMPEFAFSNDEARAIAAYLVANSQPMRLIELPARQKAETTDAAASVTIDERREGEVLFRSIGCLACHRAGDLGNVGIFSSGDLSSIGTKRSVDWLFTWLGEPARLNADHAMPVFKLTLNERRSLAIYLSSLGSNSIGSNEQPDAVVNQELIAKGRTLVEAARCASCHRIAGLKSNLAGVPDLSQPISDIERSCLATTTDATHRRPTYKHVDRDALLAFLNSRMGSLSAISSFTRGAHLLDQRNCLACHERGAAKGLVDTAGSVVKSDESLKGESQGLIPPALTAVGDKLLDVALREAVGGDQKRVRLPWLRVRMPRFQHSEEERTALVEYLIAHDRIPDGAPTTETDANAASVPRQTQTLLDGHALVGPKGFVCIACHEIGKYKPRNVSLGTHGSDLLMLGERMRRPFYLRWTRGPLRIVPGMEMPSYSRPLPGILDNDVDKQLAATWDALNDPRFVPPASPTVVEQTFAVERGERPRIIHDVFTNPSSNGGGYIPRALAVGFENGHNMLLDLDRAAVRQWTFGEFAQQRTEGKSWFWDMTGVPVVDNFRDGADLAISLNPAETQLLFPRMSHGTRGKLVHYQLLDLNGEPAVEIVYQIEFWYRDNLWKYEVRELLQPITLKQRALDESNSQPVDKPTGWRRGISIRFAGHNSGQTEIQLPFTPTFYVSRPKIDSTQANVSIDTATQDNEKRFTIKENPDREFIRIPNDTGQNSAGIDAKFSLEYRSSLERNSLKPKPAALPPARPIQKITTVPGYDGLRLPIDGKIMPTAMTWTRDGTLAFTSLKGQVYLARDTNDDGLEDQLILFEEGLASPWGILADGKDLIVAHKPELLRLRDTDGDDRADERIVIASGWGYTENYHDWTTGIVRDDKGRFYVGLGSDYTQRDRPQGMARWRGKVLRISFNGEVTPIGHALRYPTGLAIDPKGRIFVSDNQGEQNTFNEINHLVEGAHYGVPARWEEDSKAPAVAPAIQIPHPWTRSVNGLFFLDHLAGGAYLANHGIGCEYDSRFLVRFTVQEVDGVVQGAVYHFSRPNGGIGPDNFLGPLCGGESPKGDVYVGSVWDSGWQGGQNTGEIVRLRRNNLLPNGIREVRATHDGFDILFISPVDVDQARKPSAYSISGYTRLWKGGYATPDSGRHSTEIKAVEVSGDGTIAHLHCSPLREGFVYEVYCGGITTGSPSPLWPDTGHYTLHKIP